MASPESQAGAPAGAAVPGPDRRRAVRVGLAVGAVVVVVVGAGLAGRGLRGGSASVPAADPVAAVGAPADAPGPVAKVVHPVDVRKPAGPPVFHTGIKDARGNSVTMACAECHKTKEPNPAARLGKPMQFFHQSLAGAHGNLTCASCHNPADGYSTLRLADGSAVAYTEVMQLCAQCHGPQYRDYQHGAHGGMAGHWDLTRGGRTRANCVDCHSPHAPKFQPVLPAKGPNDRGSARGAGHE